MVVDKCEQNFYASHDDMCKEGFCFFNFFLVWFRLLNLSLILLGDFGIYQTTERRRYNSSI